MNRITLLALLALGAFFANLGFAEEAKTLEVTGKFIKNDNTYLEREPLETVTKKKQLAAFKHEGFWQCMDTKRDKDKLNKILNSKKYKF